MDLRRTGCFFERAADNGLTRPRTVGDGAIAGSQGRYRLAVPVDAALFTSALSAVSSRDDRIEALERALAMWTGPPFDELAAEAWAGPEVVRLTELHASAVEDHAIELIAERRWADHRASVLIVLAGCRRRRLGELDTQAHAALDQAAGICAAHSLSRLLATVDEMRQVRRG